MLNVSEMIEVNRNAVSVIARIAVTFRTLFFLKYFFERFFITFVLLFPKRISLMFLSPLLRDFTIFNPNNAVGKLGDFVVVGNHYQRLMEFFAGGFQKPQYITARPAV